MGRLTKRQAGEYVYVHYGINTKTYKVETAYQTRGGVLSVWRGDQNIRYPLAGRRAEAECRIVFDLTELYSIPISMDDSETTKRKLGELRVKAEEMKAKSARQA